MISPNLCTLLFLFIAINCILCYQHHTCSSFLPSPFRYTTRYNKKYSNSNVVRFLSQNKNDNMDDDDDFDPRNSPHMYPKGVNGGVNNKKDDRNDDSFLNSHSFNMNDDKSSSSAIVDIDDGFDPRISPHMYSNGVNGGVGGNKESNDDVGYYSSTASKSNSNGYNTNDDDFDPRVSPHMYPNGINNGREQQQQQQYSSTTETEQKKIGILLIDHGSKREESNLHLEKVALAYQKENTNNFIVKVAHMEIAKPSIQDGIQMLLDLNVEKVICHPYFLSPGKHAIKDVPFLLSEAKKNVINTMDVPIVSTDPLGLHIDLMINVIDKTVQRHLDDSGNKNDDSVVPSSSLNGFFGDIQKQMEDM